MNRLQFFLILLLVASIGSIVVIRQNTETKSRVNATWLWNTQEIVKNPHKIITFLASNNIEDLYLQVDYDLDFNHYKEFIQLANEESINVHALEGSPDWVARDGAKSQLVFFNWVKRYQEEALDHQRLKGIHLDVEPYLHEDYDSDRNKTLERYQDCLHNALLQSKSLELPLSIDMPFWFDSLEYNTGYGKGILAEWIISRVESVVIMAYRDKSQGDNGIINLVSAELELATQYGATIIIAVETESSSEGNHISFYGKEGHSMNKELEIVYKRYGKTTSFDGFAIHHLISWMDLS